MEVLPTPICIIFSTHGLLERIFNLWQTNTCQSKVLANGNTTVRVKATRMLDFPPYIYDIDIFKT